MSKDYDFSRGDQLPASFLDALNEYISTAAFGVRAELASSTTVRVPAGPDNDQVGLGIDGQWRYVTSAVTTTHPGGGAGPYGLWAIASARNVVQTPAPDTDLTDYSFGLRITAPGVTPAGNHNGNAISFVRQIGQVQWDGVKIIAVDMAVGAASGVARHASSHAVSGADRLLPSDIGAAAQSTIDGLSPMIPTAGQKAALPGTTGMPGDGNRYVTDSDPRLSDQRVPTAGSVDATKVSGSLKPSSGASAATEALRALGTAPTQAAAGNDPRLSDARTPTAHTHTISQITDLSTDPAANVGGLRTLGSGAQQAMAGNDSRVLSGLTRREARVFLVGGEVVSDYLTSGIPAMPIEAWTGDTVKLLGIQSSLASGASVTFKIQRSVAGSNAKSDVPGLGTTGAPLSITPGDYVKKLDLGASPVTLSDGDRLWLTLVAVTGTPTDLSVSLVMSRTVSS